MTSPRPLNPRGISRGAFHKGPKVTALIKRKGVNLSLPYLTRIAPRVISDLW